MTYQAPVKDMLFVLNRLAGLPQVAALPGFEEATPDTVQAVLEESARYAGDVLAPLNQPADREPSAWRDGAVTTSPGFKQAFRQYAEAGWQGMTHPVEYGGQGLPGLLGSPCSEMLNAANLSFALCPLLTNGAIEALLTAGSPELRERYIGPMIEGRWTGTMNLTEPQAGSDLAMIRSRAQPADDGTYRISGTKIFITYGEHDLAENIVHLVLARLPDAPEGVKGISLSWCPSSWSTRTARWARATTCNACRSSTSWASRPAPPRPCSSATPAARWAIWWARKTAAWTPCSS